MIQAHTGPSQTMVRLFIAVGLPYDVKHELCRLQKSFKQSNVLVGTYPKPEAMHLTVKFIGDVQGTAVPEIQRALHGIKYKRLAARLSLLASFGNPHAPKVLFVDVDCPELANFVHMLDDVLIDFCEPEEREFKAHLTIVRVRKTIDTEGLLSLLDTIHVNPLSFSIDHFSLMQSKLNSSGPVHTTIARYELIP